MTIAQNKQEAEQVGQDFLTQEVGPALLDILRGGEAAKAGAKAKAKAAMDRLAELGIPRLGCTKLSPKDLVTTRRFLAPCEMEEGSLIIPCGDQAGKKFLIFRGLQVPVLYSL